MPEPRVREKSLTSAPPPAQIGFNYGVNRFLIAFGPLDLFRKDKHRSPMIEAFVECIKRGHLIHPVKRFAHYHQLVHLIGTLQKIGRCPLHESYIAGPLLSCLDHR